MCVFSLKLHIFKKLAQVDHNSTRDTWTFCGVGKTTLPGGPADLSCSPHYLVLA